MKNLLFLASAFCCLCFIVSCKSKQVAASTTPTEVREGIEGQTYRVIISFMSKGAGTNSDQKTAILTYIEKHSKKPVSKKVLWGREGETDYCLTLKELKVLNKQSL